MQQHGLPCQRMARITARVRRAAPKNPRRLPHKDRSSAPGVADLAVSAPLSSPCREPSCRWGPMSTSTARPVPLRLSQERKPETQEPAQEAAQKRLRNAPASAARARRAAFAPVALDTARNPRNAKLGHTGSCETPRLACWTWFGPGKTCSRRRCRHRRCRRRSHHRCWPRRRGSSGSASLRPPGMCGTKEMINRLLIYLRAISLVPVLTPHHAQPKRRNAGGVDSG